MSDSVTIELRSVAFPKPLTFYGHWSGDLALTAIEEVLPVTTRIGDSGYLAAQIFYAFTKLSNYDGKSGFGIYTGPADGYDDNPTHFVDLDTGEYSVGGDDWFDRYGQPLDNRFGLPSDDDE